MNSYRPQGCCIIISLTKLLLIVLNCTGVYKCTNTKLMKYNLLMILVTLKTF